MSEDEEARRAFRLLQLITARQIVDGAETDLHGTVSDDRFKLIAQYQGWIETQDERIASAKENENETD